MDNKDPQIRPLKNEPLDGHAEQVNEKDEQDHLGAREREKVEGKKIPGIKKLLLGVIKPVVDLIDGPPPRQNKKQE